MIQTRGSITLTTLVAGSAAVVALLVGSLVVSHAMATHSAHSASDLAALGAATEALAVWNDEACCVIASDIARANGARMTACQIVRAGDEVAASVAVEVKVAWTLPVLPAVVVATSYAGNPAVVGP